MVDFSKILSAGAVARLQAVKQEMDRLHGLQDRWLGEELLRVTREARTLLDKHFPTAHAGYDQLMLNEVVPEIARRLGCKLDANEAQHTDYRHVDGPRLRQALGHCFNNQNIGMKGYELRRMQKDAGQEAPDYTALDIIGHEFVNGNPAAMAMDRVCAPAPEGADSDDWLARHTREISRTRGHEPMASWSPAMRGNGRKHTWKDPDDDRVIELDF